MSKQLLLIAALSALATANLPSCRVPEPATVASDEPPTAAEEEWNLPRNLSECWAELDRVLPEERRRAIRDNEGGAIGEHFGAGLWMRNAWLLWGGGHELTRYLDSVGRDADGFSRVYDGDSRSGYILETYRMHLLHPESAEEEIVRMEWRQFEEMMRRFDEEEAPSKTSGD
ncbi:MAG: DUF6794 domain-containing protein [Planctomycetota bacterium]